MADDAEPKDEDIIAEEPMSDGEIEAEKKRSLAYQVADFYDRRANEAIQVAFQADAALWTLIQKNHPQGTKKTMMSIDAPNRKIIIRKRKVGMGRAMFFRPSEKAQLQFYALDTDLDPKKKSKR